MLITLKNFYIFHPKNHFPLWFISLISHGWTLTGVLMFDALLSWTSNLTGSGYLRFVKEYRTKIEDSRFENRKWRIGNLIANTLIFVYITKTFLHWATLSIFISISVLVLDLAINILVGYEFRIWLLCEIINLCVH